MKIVVYPHDLGMGGSQLNAIELAAEVARHGHEVMVFGQDGPLSKRIAELGLEFIQSPPTHRRPTLGIGRAVEVLAKRRDLDIVHGYEWPPTLEAVLGVRRTTAVAVSTVLSMSVAPFIPDYVPLLVGTEQIMAAERLGRRTVGLMEPPVDTRLNSPLIHLPVDDFRRRWRIDPHPMTLVIVSRVAKEMKLEGILSAMAVVERLNANCPVQLVIVGSGPAVDDVKKAAGRVNTTLGTRRVIVTGELSDPRAAYAIADIALGMGGSALRAMAFGKPLVVQGVNGFWEVLSPETLPLFHWQGWFGQGNGQSEGQKRLFEILRSLIANDARRRDLAAFSLETVRERFSLTQAAENLLEFYDDALVSAAVSRRRKTRSNARALSTFLGHESRRQMSRFSGKFVDEDFNVCPTLSRSEAYRQDPGAPGAAMMKYERTDRPTVEQSNP